ncbi:Uncharacterised protein [Streptococcus pneumoniae]|nr:Uncharacterised protein [Streptococcus pneumoniae]
MSFPLSFSNVTPATLKVRVLLVSNSFSKGAGIGIGSCSKVCCSGMISSISVLGSSTYVFITFSLIVSTLGSCLVWMVGLAGAVSTVLVSKSDILLTCFSFALKAFLYCLKSCLSTLNFSPVATFLTTYVLTMYE